MSSNKRMIGLLLLVCLGYGVGTVLHSPTVVVPDSYEYFKADGEQAVKLYYDGETYYSKHGDWTWYDSNGELVLKAHGIPFFVDAGELHWRFIALKHEQTGMNLLKAGNQPEK